jgi:hypothetical protein
MNRLIRLLILCLLSAPLSLSSLAPRTAAAQDVAGVLVARINELRASQGLNTLSYNNALAAAAQSHSRYLATTPYSHPHRQSNGSLPQDRAAAAGYSGRVGENVVGGRSASLDWAFNWWMNSSVHYSNMLGNWTEIGVGFSDGGEYGRWYVVVFGNGGRAPVQAEGVTGANPAAGRNAAQPTAAPPRPTRPPTQTPTPTITLTPSMTYTPRPTFTPTDTPTGIPPTATAILIAISTAAPNAPTPTPLSVATLGETATPAAVAIAVANTDTPPSLPPALAQPESAPPPNPLRLIIPLIIALNVLIIGGVVLGNLLRRR